MGPSARTGRTTRYLGPGRLSRGRTAEGRASESVPVRGLLRTLPADRPHRRVRWPSILHALPRASFPLSLPGRICTSRPAESSRCEPSSSCQPHDHVPRLMMCSVIAHPYQRSCRSPWVLASGGRVYQMNQDGADHRASAELAVRGTSWRKPAPASPKTVHSWRVSDRFSPGTGLRSGPTRCPLASAPYSPHWGRPTQHWGTCTSFSGFASRSWEPGLRLTDS